MDWISTIFRWTVIYGSFGLLFAEVRHIIPYKQGELISNLLGSLLCRSSLSTSSAGASLKCVWQHAPVLEAFLHVGSFWVAVNHC